MQQKFGLAPMEGVTELPFRLWMSQVSAPPFMGTPFLRATDTFPKLIPEDFAPELGVYREWVNYQLIPQVMASRAEDFCRTARLLLETAAWVDLNAGCPSPNPISGGAGSGLLKEPERFRTFMEEIAFRLPAHSFSVKMRTGFETNELFAHYLDTLRTIPLQRLTIHGRTRRDRYDHASRWDLIAAAAAQMPCPVVASGDIVSRASWLERAPLAGAVEYVIVGRGALRNPWLFLELQAAEPQPSLLTVDLLAYALATLGLLLQAHHQANPQLDPLIRSGCFRGCCGLNLDSWKELYARAVQTLAGRALRLEELDFERTIMGRLKMIWNSLRSSLPDAFFAPLLMRATSFQEWLLAWQEFAPGGAPMRLAHRPELDWLFTSSRLKPDTSA